MRGSVPYSEHSSYTELQALVGLLKPRTLVPTVNAQTRTERERLEGLFAPSMDLARDKRKLDWHFSPNATQAGRARWSDGERDVLATVNTAQQRELWGRLALGLSPIQPFTTSPSAEATSAAGALGALGAPTTTATEAPPTAAEQLVATVLGEDAPLAYVRSLLESGGDPGTAIAIHFGANEGSVPQEWRANETGVVPGAEHGSHLDVARSNGQGDEMQQGGGVEDARRALRSAETEESEELQLSVGTVAWVLGKEFKLYKSREALQARLAALGAAVIGEGGTR